MQSRPIHYDQVCVFEEAAILESHGIEVQSPGGQSNSDEVDGSDFPDQVSCPHKHAEGLYHRDNTNCGLRHKILLSSETLYLCIKCYTWLLRGLNNKPKERQ